MRASGEVDQPGRAARDMGDGGPVSRATSVKTLGLQWVIGRAAGFGGFAEWVVVAGVFGVDPMLKRGTA